MTTSKVTVAEQDVFEHIAGLIRAADMERMAFSNYLAAFMRSRGFEPNAGARLILPMAYSSSLVHFPPFVRFSAYVTEATPVTEIKYD